MMFYDFHTHRLPDDPAVTALVSAPERIYTPRVFWSLELHPWEQYNTLPPDWAERAQAADALGEAGLDRLRGAPWLEQVALFEAVAAIAHRLNKPLLIHQVRAVDELLRCRRRFPHDRWLCHGWRSTKPEALGKLLAAGIRIGIGDRTPDAAIRQIGAYPALAACESDDAEGTLITTYQRIAALWEIPLKDVVTLMGRNFESFLSCSAAPEDAAEGAS